MRWPTVIISTVIIIIVIVAMVKQILIGHLHLRPQNVLVGLL